MTENVYEGLFILDANRYARDPAGVSGRVSALIEKHGGTLLANRLWEERRLAYPIRGQKKGTYWLTYFRVAGSKIGPITEEAQRDDNFLRQLFLKVDPRIVETLVSHAQERKEDVPPAGSAPNVEDKKEKEAKTANEAKTDKEAKTDNEAKTDKEAKTESGEKAADEVEIAVAE